MSVWTQPKPITLTLTVMVCICFFFSESRHVVWLSFLRPLPEADRHSNRRYLFCTRSENRPAFVHKAYSCLHLVVFRIYLHWGRYSSYADQHTVRRPTYGQLWPRSFKRVDCAVSGQRYETIWRFNTSLLRVLTVGLVLGEVFVVQWERVRLPGKESKGAFTFQAALYKTGRITFSYRDVRQIYHLFFQNLITSLLTSKENAHILFSVHQIPLPLDEIGSEQPVKVGLSDAFVVKSSSSQSPGSWWLPLSFIQGSKEPWGNTQHESFLLQLDAAHQTIHEYHRVEIDVTKITNHSAVELTPLPSN